MGMSCNTPVKKKLTCCYFLGFTNSSLYTGNIDFQNIPSGQESFWILPMTGMTVQGNSVALPTGTESYSAIDTGTTLVGGPSAAMQALFAQIPGSAPGTGDYEGYFTYRKRLRFVRFLVCFIYFHVLSLCYYRQRHHLIRWAKLASESSRLQAHTNIPVAVCRCFLRVANQ